MQSEMNSFVAEPAIWQAQLPGRPLSGLTVLLVEDSRYASEAIRLLCLRSGARIRRADRLLAAMRHLQTYRPNIVLVDMGLPDGDGASLIRRIKAAGDQTPLVLGISGDPDLEDAAISAGAAGFISKPIDSLAAFQETLLAALPDRGPRSGPRLLPNEVVRPDPRALREDLAHVADVLTDASDGAAIDYIARFLTGVARSAHDTPLAQAAAALARDHEAGRGVATDLTRISGMVHERLLAAGRQ